MSKYKKNIIRPLVFTIYLILILGSSYIFYKSFNHYSNINAKDNYESKITKATVLNAEEKEFIIEEITSKKIEQEILMLNSMIVLLFTAFLFFKRKNSIDSSEFEEKSLNVFLNDTNNSSGVNKATLAKFSNDEKTFKDLAKDKSIINNKKKDIGVKREQKAKKLFSQAHTLVVEDNPINQKMIQHTLKNIGITSDCADNGQIGLEMFMKNHDKYDMVFMDIQMPVMNGIESTKAILSYEERNGLEHTPIIAVTANALKGDRENFMSEGMDEYVSKPINLEEFMRVLKMYFSEESSSEELPIVSKTDILLYKETPMEAKIIAAILNKLNYSVDVVENIDELKKVMDVNSYKCILLDKVTSEVEHSSVTNHIKSKDIPSLLFVDGEAIIAPSDEENFTFISDKITDYQSIKTKVDQLISLAKAS